tara:strand:+ start:1561 stop:1818 length:258 start_codon:yes stop_codon:yes gene_type:complete
MINIKECYVSKNGISCFTDINTLHNIKEINMNNRFVINIKNSLIFYISLRLTEFILVDFIKNKDILFKNIDNNDDFFFLTSIIFN